MSVPFNLKFSLIYYGKTDGHRNNMLYPAILHHTRHSIDLVSLRITLYIYLHVLILKYSKFPQITILSRVVSAK